MSAIEPGSGAPEHESRNPVSSVPGPPLTNFNAELLPSADSDARAGDPLGLQHIPVTGFTSGIAIPEAASGVSDGASEASASGFLVVSSTAEELAEARAFFHENKNEETDGQKTYARQRSTVFSLMQYRRLPSTGRVIWTQEQFDQLIEALVEAEILDRAAAIWQDKDTDEDDQPIPVHMHAAIKLKPGAEKSIRWISDRAEIPASRIQTPKEWRSKSHLPPEMGPMAAERAFWDFCSYLTHEHKGGA